MMGRTSRSYFLLAAARQHCRFVPESTVVTVVFQTSADSGPTSLSVPAREQSRRVLIARTVRLRAQLAVFGIARVLGVQAGLIEMVSEAFAVKGLAQGTEKLALQYKKLVRVIHSPDMGHGLLRLVLVLVVPLSPLSFGVHPWTFPQGEELGGCGIKEGIALAEEEKR